MVSREGSPTNQGMMTKPRHDAAPEKKVPATTIATWPIGTFVENIVALPDGALVVSVVSEHRLTWIRPGGERRAFAEFRAPPTGLSLVGDDLFVNVGEPGKPGWSIHRVGPDERTKKVVDVAEALFLNGSTPLRGSRVLVVDSILGKAFEVDTRTGEYGVWLEHPHLSKCTDEPMMPGVNGVKAFRGSVYFTSTERALILRVTVTPSGAAGDLEILAEHFLGDDFALDVQGNLYVTTHVYNQLQRLSTDGVRSVLADADEGLHGSTAVTFGRTEHDRRSLYVTTTGGIVAPFDGQVREAKLIRLDVGVEGAPLTGI